jgi:hypothetical protein
MKYRVSHYVRFSVELRTMTDSTIRIETVAGLTDERRICFSPISDHVACYDQACQTAVMRIQIPPLGTSGFDLAFH